MMQATSSESSLILVTGATGRHGGTGGHVARRLREEGRRVRVLVRGRDHRSAELEAAGLDVHVGDLRDRASLVRALEGVTDISFCFPVDGGIVEAASSFAAAVREACPSARVVVMSMVVAQAASPTHLGRAQWLAEEVMSWAGLDLCVLRIAAMFYENLALLHGASIREEGVLRNCFGDARTPWIAGEDAAELVVAALLHPERFTGAAVHYPVGAALHTHAELVEILSAELDTRVRYEPVSPDAWKAELLELARRTETVLNDDMAAHISAVGAALAHRGPAMLPNAVALERATGRAPISFRDFVQTHADAFRPASARPTFPA